MKRIPFTIEAWKAGGVPMTKQCTKIIGLTELNSDCTGEYEFKFAGKLIGSWTFFSKGEMLLEVPCTKYYTHYYKNNYGHHFAELDKNPKFSNYSPEHYTHIKTVEVEL